MNHTDAQQYVQQLEAAMAQIRPWGAVAIVGAGMSFAGYPMTAGLNPLLWQALDACPPALHATARTIGQPPTPAKDLLGNNWDKLSRGYQQLRLHADARASFQLGFQALDRQRQPSPAHQAMARLMHHGLIELTVSFNWDTAVERAWGAQYGTPLPAAAAQFVKPHGDAARPRAAWILPDEPGFVPPDLAERVRAMLTERPRVLLIVGYSESDEDVVTQLTGPMGQQWPVVRIGPSATGPLAVTATADDALPDLASQLVPEPELPGWRWVDYSIQRDLGAALRGYRLTSQDAEACPQSPEAADVAQRLTVANLARLQAPSGCGKSVTAFQAARMLNHDGWEVVELAETGVATRATVQSLARTHYPTVAVVDDAQALRPEVLTSLERLASSRLKVLLVHTDDENAPSTDPATVHLLPTRAVQLLADHISAHQNGLLSVLSRLDDRLGQKPFTISVDERLAEARQASRPWQFMFVLTGGERRAAEEVAFLREHNRADLLLAVLSAQQLLSLDAGIDETTLLPLAAGNLDRSQRWAHDALAALVGRRLALPGERIRTPHQRFAAYALRAVLRTGTQPDEQLLQHLRRQLTDPTTALRGIHWLLDDLRQVEQLRYRRPPLLMDETTTQTLVDRCIHAPRQERAAAAMVLWHVTWWGEEARTQVLSRDAIIARWISEATTAEAYSLRWAASGLRSDRGEGGTWATTAAQIPPLQFAHRLNTELTAGSVYSWSELVGELWQVVPQEWKKECVEALDRATLLTAAHDLDEYSVHGYTKLAMWCAAADISLYFEMMSEAAPAISRTLTTAPGQAVNNLFDFLLATYWAEDPQPQDDARRRFVEEAKVLVRRIIAATSWETAADVVSKGDLRSWGSLDVLAHWLHSHDPIAYATFTDNITLASLDTRTAGLWHDMMELRSITQTLSCGTSREPGRSWITTHADEITTMPSWAIAIAPDTAAAISRRGGTLSLGLSGGAHWDWAADALQSLTETNRPVAVELLRCSRSDLTNALTNNQFHSANGLAEFLNAADTCAPDIVDAALEALAPTQISESWPAMLDGADEQRIAAATLITRTARIHGPMGEQARQLQRHLPVGESPSPGEADA
ncbi:hypothetical protein ADK55_07955 [Streptomyces sp. WM4235]|uniref:hypothetical protein n=1 Tax=Streptomyces sp. WM4235 TaxID=1415551 RepID=UPI0006ADB933|nr:hypothetical protein [Streptomyces sp. WM4235]KOU63669.1 hypothetical protein ADK55_07955 [Streptomyces sp. WM4235]